MTTNFEPGTLHNKIINTRGETLYKSDIPMSATDILNAAIDVGADLTNAYFERWHFEGVIGPESGIFGIYEFTMYKCHVRNATFQGLNLVRAKINCTNIYNTEFIQCRIPRCGMTLTNLVKVTAHCTSFERLLYSNGKIKDSKFVDCNFFYARFFTDHIDDDVMFSESHLFASGFQTIPLSLTGAAMENPKEYMIDPNVTYPDQWTAVFHNKISQQAWVEKINRAVELECV